MVGEGKFQLYSKVEPALTAGLYKFAATQHIAATGPSGSLGGQLKVEQLGAHVRVRAPQYVLAPDQVLSTYPPAGHVGAFGARLPQVVLRRRTLPWERDIDASHPEPPWLALVVFTGNEATLLVNQKVERCVTDFTPVDTPAESELGNCLEVQQSMVHRIFPTQEELELLAHVREVDIDDTELMMGDDDGHLAVVISNRLPLPARDQSDKEVPTEYTACLVNLCGQWDALLDKAPETVTATEVPLKLPSMMVTLAEMDHAAMGLERVEPTPTIQPISDPAIGAVDRTVIADVVAERTGGTTYEGAVGWGGAQAGIVSDHLKFTDSSAAAAAREKAGKLDPVLRFPVLLHWKFTTHGSQTFESLMAGLDSGLLGTTSTNLPHRQAPFEVIETGHLGLAHRLRSGDQVRSWYRGPLVPHPTVVDPAARLPLAHTADQVRTVVPDRREDISLAAAFEIGRLLGLSRPSMVAALLRWRQLGFQVAHRRAMVAAQEYADVLDGFDLTVDVDFGQWGGALVAERLVEHRVATVGNPAPLVTPGRGVVGVEAVNEVLATGFGLDPEVFDAAPGVVVERLSEVEGGLPTIQQAAPSQLREMLTPRLDTNFARVAVQALAPQIRDGTVDLGSRVRLPHDLTNQLEHALTPDTALRRRLDLDVDVARLPETADALDVLVRAERAADLAADRTGDRKGEKR